mmetsp:Transcript_7314/g.16862  ORF Transcript_7314/g.16862 Transcript_7314/m.16862 type:complete len:229 (-) Transcript_7314:136-822(-)
MKRLASAIAGAAISSLVGPTVGSGRTRSLDLRGSPAAGAPHTVELEPFSLELLLEEPLGGAGGGSVRGGIQAARRLLGAGDELASIASDHLESRFGDNVYGDCIGVELDIITSHGGAGAGGGRVVSYEISGRARFADEITPLPESLTNQVAESFASRDGAADFVRRLGLSRSGQLARVQDVAAPTALLYSDGDSHETARHERRYLGVSDIDWKEVADRNRCGRYAQHA